MNIITTEEQAVSLAVSIGNSAFIEEKKPWISEFISGLPYEIQKAILAINPYQIQFIDNPSTELQLIAIRKHVNCFEKFFHLKNIEPEVICEAISLSLDQFNIRSSVIIEKTHNEGIPDFIHHLLFRAKYDDSVQELLIKTEKWGKIPPNIWSNNIRKKYKYIFSMRVANIL